MRLMNFISCVFKTTVDLHHHYNVVIKKEQLKLHESFLGMKGDGGGRAKQPSEVSKI